MLNKRPAPAPRRSVDTLIWMGVFLIVGILSFTLLEADHGARNVGLWISICGVLLMVYIRYFDKSDR